MFEQFFCTLQIIRYLKNLRPLICFQFKIIINNLNQVIYHLRNITMGHNSQIKMMHYKIKVNHTVSITQFPFVF
jgi:hypothetical protein